MMKRAKFGSRVFGPKKKSRNTQQRSANRRDERKDRKRKQMDEKLMGQRDWQTDREPWVMKAAGVKALSVAGGYGSFI